MIRQISFKHGWFYHYRIHQKKADTLCKNFSSLSFYLNEMFTKCPDEYFHIGPRSSSLKMNLIASVENIKNHPLCKMTKQALILNEYKTPHSKVEIFMLNFDENTIGVEVPIWLMPEELEGYNELFNDKNPLTGHIDILQVKNDKIWILDFKPKAHLEKYAVTQTYFYALMLSKRIGVGIDNFMCGYFDEKQLYLFDPKNIQIPKPIPQLIQY